MESLLSRAKAELRRKLRNLGGGSAEEGRALCSRILETEEYKNAKLVFAFYGVEPEPDTSWLIEEMLRDGKKVALPKSRGDGTMDFYEISSLSELVPGLYKIPEPPESAPRVPRREEGGERRGPILAIVPGLAFDLKGTRLGRGGGYYDRFLADFPLRTIGLCFEKRLFDAMPWEAYDVPVSAIVTEKRYIPVVGSPDSIG